MTLTDHRRFYFARDEDVSGISGTGRVADGVLWVDGSVSMRWRGEYASFANWDQFAKAVKIHCHEGKTRVVWLDGDGPDYWAEQPRCLGKPADAPVCTQAMFHKGPCG